MTLTEFLLARLDEERGLIDRAFVEVRDNPYWGGDWAAGMTGGMGGPGGDLAAVYGPERVLDEWDAKRRIISYLGGDRAGFGDPIDPILRLLALPYATHEDYQPAWRP